MAMSKTSTYVQIKFTANLHSSHVHFLGFPFEPWKRQCEKIQGLCKIRSQVGKQQPPNINYP